jgi:hypothetical protein
MIEYNYCCREASAFRTLPRQVPAPPVVGFLCAPTTTHRSREPACEPAGFLSTYRCSQPLHRSNPVPMPCKGRSRGDRARGFVRRPLRNLRDRQPLARLDGGLRIAERTCLRTQDFYILPPLVCHALLQKENRPFLFPIPFPSLPMKDSIPDPILAHHLRAIKMVRDSLIPQRHSDCCGTRILDIDDHDVCSRCGEVCIEAR